MARYKIQFWLNSEKIDELNVADTVAELKQRRSFSAVVRDGIMIVKELREGRVDLLLKLFPFVKDAILELFPPTQPPPTDEITELKRMIERLIEQQGRALPDTRDHYPLLIPAGTKPASAPPVIAPKAAPLADAGAIADNFLAFIQ